MSSAIALKQPQQLDRLEFEPHSFSDLEKFGEILFNSGLIPKQKCQSPQAAMTIALMGRDLGLSAMQAINGIHVIEGRPSVGAETMHALILSSGVAEIFEVVEMSEARCLVRAQRRGDQSVLDVVWTIEMAQRKGLAGKNNWKQWPESMLRARAVSQAAKARFPDVIRGLEVAEVMLDVGEARLVPQAVLTDEPKETGEPKRGAEAIKAKIRAKPEAPEYVRKAQGAMLDIRRDLSELTTVEAMWAALEGTHMGGKIPGDATEEDCARAVTEAAAVLRATREERRANIAKHEAAAKEAPEHVEAALEKLESMFFDLKEVVGPDRAQWLFRGVKIGPRLGAETTAKRLAAAVEIYRKEMAKVEGAESGGEPVDATVPDDELPWDHGIDKDGRHD